MAANWKCANYTLKMSALNWSKASMNHIRHNHILILFYEQSNHTPRCSRKVSAVGLPWLGHFRVQCYTWVKSLLVGFRRKSSLLLSYKTWNRRLKESGFCVADLAEVGRLRVLWLLKKSFTRKGGVRHQFINHEQQGTPSPALYLCITQVISAWCMVARSIHTTILYICILNVWHHVSGKIT